MNDDSTSNSEGRSVEDSSSEDRRAPESPCVRNCCLDEQDICLGCFRTLDEILAWSASSPQEKRLILAHCQQRKAARGNGPTTV